VTKVLTWGCNLGVKIPSRIARATRLTHGQQVTVTLEKGRIVVEPLPPMPTLERLLAGVTAENSRTDLDWHPADEGERPGSRGWRMSLHPTAHPPWRPGTGDVVSVRMMATSPGGGCGESRPALVLSPARYCDRTGIVLVAPIVAAARGYPFEVPIPPRACVTGAVLADRVSSVDLRRCPVGLTGRLTGDVIAAVLERLLPLLVPGDDVEQLVAIARAYTHASQR
jgi:mRNA-degrading endonuclease toxin of MazEF toxin-antitoxin module/antitoxin component of MazEF toxin-antitoxin module